MHTRRKFLQSSLLSSFGVFLSNSLRAGAHIYKPASGPIVLSTWAPNVKANAEAWKILSAGGRALDAVEAGVKIPEADPEDQSVGYGGLPDRDGRVTLDSCIMDEFGNCGAVMCMENIMHAVSVARLVMEKTPHVQLAGDGAMQFALSQGFKKQNLLTQEAEKVWRNWLKTSKYNPMITVENIQDKMEKDMQVPGQQNNHDTIGMIAIDAKGNLSGACTTSGMAFKMHGRVGDSPIVGAGLFVDNEIGAATATGVGEEMVRMCGSHTIVELMRQGYTAEEACRQAIQRVIKKNGEEKARQLQVGFIALRKDGSYGGCSVVKGFNYAVRSTSEEKVYDAKNIL